MTSPGSNILFPRNFKWGAATAAYQIEGAAKEDGRGQSIWDVFSHTPGKILDGTTGDITCDHYRLWRQDIDLMNSIGLKNYRFSISWPRVQPGGKGPANRKGLDFYDRLVDGLLESGIEPFVTLYHWDLPQELFEIGGWTNRDVGEYFADYAAMMVKVLGDRVKFWCTFNEPWVIARLGHRTGEMAPGIADEKIYHQVIHNLLLAHGLGRQAIKSVRSEALIGIVLILFPCDPQDPNDNADIVAADLLWESECQAFLDPLFRGSYPERWWKNLGNLAPETRPGDLALICQDLDYLGVNFYFRFLVSAEMGRIDPVPGAELTEMGWEIRPSSLKELLLKLNAEYRLPPIFITEGGAAFDDKLDSHGRVKDERRIKYLQDQFVELYKAIRAGVDVKGYFVWSLLDNFEWAFGLSKRFGLFYTDYASLKRYPKDSAHWYASVIQRNGFDHSL